MDKDSHLRRLGEEFQLSWKSDRPDLKEFLSRVDDSEKEALAAILIPIDFVQRLMRGAPPPAAEYEQFGQGFGNLAKELLQGMTMAWSSSESSQVVDPTVDMPPVDIEKTADFLGETTVGTSDKMRSNDGTEIPRQIGSYRLLRELGEGGMGRVWIAQQSEPVKRQVALKLIKAGIGSKEILARFDAERQALAMMSHPNIARILDAGATKDNQPYFVMELVEGIPLTKYCDKHRLTIQERLKLFTSVCEGVQHAHQKGVIHRDLKPGNIIVATIDGRPVPKVIDFGLAKAIKSEQQLTDATLATGIGQVLGTLKYMSPEQASLDAIDVDTRTDVYALGVILYELLTGSTPLDDESIKGAAILSVLELIRDKDPPRPSQRLSNSKTDHSITDYRNIDSSSLNRMLVGDLDWIVIKALEKDRERRYDTPSGFASDVKRFLDSEPVSARPPSFSYRASKFIRKNRVGVIAVSLLSLSLIAGVVGTSIGMTRAWSAEKKATLREASERDAKERAIEAAEGQRLAKEEAVDAAAGERLAKNSAIEAAVGERLANQKSQTRLSQLETGNAILNSVFADLDIDSVKTSNEPLEAVLAGRLVAAAKQLQEASLGDDLVNARLQSRLATSLLNLGYPLDAITLFESSIKVIQNDETVDVSEVLESELLLAKALHDADRLDDAEKRCRSILKSQHDSLGAEHQDLLVTRGRIAAILNSKGDFDGAAKILNDILEIQKTKFGEGSAQVGATLTNLAIAFQRKGDLKEAVKYFEIALEGDRKRLQENDPGLMPAVNNLGQIYVESGSVKKGLPLLQESLELCETNKGSLHPDTLSAMNNLAQVYRADKKPELAAELLEKVLQTRKDRLGLKHQKTVLAMTNLSVFYTELDDTEMAVPLAKKAFEFRMEALGKEHPQTLAAMNNLAQALRKSGQLEDALPILKDTAELTKKVLGVKHIQTVTAMNNYAGGIVSTGSFENAIPVFEETIKAMEEAIGAEHPTLFVAMGNLGLCYRNVGRHQEAIKILTDVWERKKKKFGEDNVSTITSEGNLAKAYQIAGEFDAASGHFENAYVSLKSISESAPNTTIVGASLARCYCEQKKFQEAIPLLEAALPLSRIIPQLNWVQSDLLLCYAQLAMEPELETLLAEMVQKVRSSHKEDPAKLVGALQVIAKSLSRAGQFGKADPLLEESLAFHRESLPGKWQTYYAMAVVGQNKIGSEEYETAKQLLADAHEGLRKTKTEIGKSYDQRIQQVVDWLIELAEKTGNDEDLKKWQAEKLKVAKSDGENND